jgi:prepilin peptidase CpaA
MNNATVDGFTALLGTAVSDPRTVALVALLVTAAVIDCRSLRIPNALTFGGAVLALLFSALPAAAGHVGFASACAGLAAGLAILLPAYALRILGAGDVKLMAMSGAFLGWSDVLLAILFTLGAGGLLALAFALAHGSMRRMFLNAGHAIQSVVWSVAGGVRPTVVPPRETAGRLPYSLCIGAGCMASLAVRHLGYF